MVPSEYGLLSSLSAMWIPENSLTGTIPPELGVGELQKLTTLHLFTNHLSGPIPTEIYHLTKLTSLALSMNELTGSLSTLIGKLTDLNVLSLRSNFLSGTIPVSHLEELTSLTMLWLENNTFTQGTFPQSVCSFGLKFDCSDTVCGCDCACPV